ncbi:glycerate kinase type-2 family protein [Celeribacter sp.]|uniref:glycerate kinase type-2 family protein n=1 Tax=Celeribacter sp. TaxID=1890673 RepID=UPI003A8F102F
MTETCSFAAPHDAPEAFLKALAHHAIAAAKPNFGSVDLPVRPKGRVIVVGAGKAAASMAASFEAHWRVPVEGLVITRYGHATPTKYIEVVEAAHPIPDEAGVAASARLLEIVKGAGPQDLVVVLMSGGASSLLSLPCAGISLAHKQDICHQLLRSGADITEINTVRCNLSSLKAGRLAAATSAPIVTYIISDVAGDDLRTIGSGPTLPAVASPEQSFEVLRRYGIDISEEIRGAILANEAPEIAAGQTVLMGSGRTVLDAATGFSKASGLSVLDLGDAVVGEAREVGRAISGVAAAIAARNHPVRPPAIILSGGETSVTVRGDGRGGRNAEFLLGLASNLRGAANIWSVAVDTDGIDGMEDNAGAVVTPGIVQNASIAEMEDALARNDAYGFFERIGGLLFTGPTLTNVNDFRATLVLAD